MELLKLFVRWLFLALAMDTGVVALSGCGSSGSLDLKTTGGESSLQMSSVKVKSACIGGVEAQANRVRNLLWVRSTQDDSAIPDFERTVFPPTSQDWNRSDCHSLLVIPALSRDGGGRSGLFLVWKKGGDPASSPALHLSPADASGKASTVFYPAVSRGFFWISIPEALWVSGYGAESKGAFHLWIDDYRVSFWLD